MLYLTSDHFAVCESASFRFDVPPVVVNAFAFGALVLWYENRTLTALVLAALSSICDSRSVWYYWVRWPLLRLVMHRLLADFTRALSSNRRLFAILLCSCCMCLLSATSPPIFAAASKFARCRVHVHQVLSILMVHYPSLGRLGLQGHPRP